jgi:hypothetical protein
VLPLPLVLPLMLPLPLLLPLPFPAAGVYDGAPSVYCG